MTIRRNQPPRPGPRPAAARKALPIRSSKRARGGRSCLYIGKNATGKTTYALSWPGAVVLQFGDERETTDSAEEEIPVVEIPSWDTWEQLILPTLRNRERFQEAINEQFGREYPIQTLVVDDYTGLGELCEATMREREPSNSMRMYQEKLLALKATQQVLSSITRPGEGAEPWNLVGCVHEQVDTTSQLVGGAFKEVTDDIRASISGQFGKKFFSHWGLVLWCMIDLPTDQEGKILRGKKARYYCRTDPIDQWRKGVDRAGVLPSRVEGDYQTLLKHWEGKTDDQE